MLSQFAIRVQKGPANRYAVIHTEGYINNQAGEKIKEAADQLLADGVTRLILNLEKSTVINSIGISLLITVIEQIQERQGALAFCCLTKTIAKTFTIMGLAQFAEMFDTESQAVAAIGEG